MRAQIFIPRSAGFEKRASCGVTVSELNVMGVGLSAAEYFVLAKETLSNRAVNSCGSRRRPTLPTGRDDFQSRPPATVAAIVARTRLRHRKQEFTVPM